MMLRPCPPTGRPVSPAQLISETVPDLAGAPCREHRADVDPAEARSCRFRRRLSGRALGVGIRDHRKGVALCSLSSKENPKLRRPLFHQPAQALEMRVGVGSVKPWSHLSDGGRAAAEFDQGLDLFADRSRRSDRLPCSSAPRLRSGAPGTVGRSHRRLSKYSRHRREKLVQMGPPMRPWSIQYAPPSARYLELPSGSTFQTPWPPLPRFRLMAARLVVSCCYILIDLGVLGSSCSRHGERRGTGAESRAGGGGTWWRTGGR